MTEGPIAEGPVTQRRRRYTSPEEDSDRWDLLPPRPGDIVLSTRSKHGTTWVQTILLMLVHGTRLPAPVADLSPWLDHRVEPADSVVTSLEAQDHRRVIKTHTPLDGLPLSPSTHYVVVARDPLDACLSLFHQTFNLDRQRVAELTGNPSPRAGPDDGEEWLHQWVHAERDPAESLDSLDGVMWHLSDAWNRRTDDNVTLVHYADLRADPVTSVNRLARVLKFPEDLDVSAIVQATTFARMQQQPALFAPDRLGVLKDPRAFFRGGRVGDGTLLLSADDLSHYHARLVRLGPPGLLTWMHPPDGRNR